MAKDTARSGKSQGELLQIIILTLFMTAGGFALIAGLFYFYLVPARAEELTAQIADAKRLADLLDQKKNVNTGMWDLRRRVQEAQKAETTRSLKDRVQQQIGPLVNHQTSFPNTMEKKIGRTVEYSQTIEFKDAPLGLLLEFIARVKGENQSVHVGGIRMNRATRAAVGAAAGGAEEDKWSAQFNFYLYITPSVGPDKAAPVEEPVETPAEEEPSIK